MLQGKEEKELETLNFILKGLQGKEVVMKNMEISDYYVFEATILGSLIGMGEIIKKNNPEIYDVLISSIENMSLR